MPACLFLFFYVSAYAVWWPDVILVWILFIATYTRTYKHRTFTRNKAHNNFNKHKIKQTEEYLSFIFSILKRNFQLHITSNHTNEQKSMSTPIWNSIINTYIQWPLTKWLWKNFDYEYFSDQTGLNCKYFVSVKKSETSK